MSTIAKTSKVTKATTATTKVVKTPKAKKAVVVAVDTVQAVEQTFTTRFVEVLQARNAEQYSKDTDLAINAVKGSKAVDLAMSKPEFKEVASNLLKNARIASNKQDKSNFIAVKVLVKIAHCLNAIGQNMKSTLDPYSRTIAENLIALNGISNKSCLVSLSRSVEYSELEQQSALVKRYNCSANTAGTQASSTRMMLHYLDIANVQKSKNGDVITLKENDRATTFAALFIS
ncbi:hypothetical protein RGU72_04875 [Undibacterium sp. 5I1]|uniref:hypothetical protein n=1 Tax=unclassified Undibacterium TaxID=2630295 RepID=UPI002AB3C797|nr:MULTISPECIES: hypothetical protein [unclassified Undibacterium]MDY7537586.1 hypothetical protein [Undibacterium sp. 5I1]MEB0230130.1 hypothetical protein [Undibacterium sp. 10I3]MEB0256322.1 hypothetical protein [Undibacterium sp. 5I1]